ncbi:MAG: ferredoxin [Kofleriaceae bacterium]
MVTVELAKCVRCAACATTASTVFEVTRKGTRIVHQPESAAERSAVRAAALICPTRAIGTGA